MAVARFTLASFVPTSPFAVAFPLKDDDLANVRIAILTSTRPLRKRFLESGREVERLDPSRLVKLADVFGTIIIGSRAHEDFYLRMRRALPRKLRRKFIFYARSFFDRFVNSQQLSGPVDDRDEGWKEILRLNKINFVAEINVQHSEGSPRGSARGGTKTFRWTDIEQFIRDARITVIDDGFFSQTAS